MAGWDLTTVGSYARGAAPLTAVPFTWLVAGKLGTITGTQSCIALLCDADNTGDTFQLRFDTADSYAFRFTTVASGLGSSALTTNVTSAGSTFVAIARATSTTSREAILNGNLVNKGTDTNSRTPANIDRLSFGRKDDATAANQIEGVVYYSALWNTALGDSEIVTLASGAWPADAARSSLRCFWPNFTPNGSSVITDWCGRCHLTVNSGAADTSSIRRMGPHSILPPSLKRTRILRVA